jgi:hypothetical protein
MQHSSGFSRYAGHYRWIAYKKLSTRGETHAREFYKCQTNYVKNTIGLKYVQQHL